MLRSRGCWGGCNVDIQMSFVEHVYYYSGLFDVLWRNIEGIPLILSYVHFSALS